MNFYCIADEDTVRGFRLAGVEGQAVATPRQAEAALRSAAHRTNLGILIITDVVADQIRPLLDRMRAEQAHPLVVEIPGPAGPMPGRKRLSDFVQEAIGIRIRQEKEA